MFYHVIECGVSHFRVGCSNVGVEFVGDVSGSELRLEVFEGEL
jgi:hypothetical protein